MLSLERTGPYIPPITFPGLGDIILTAQARELLESSGLTGFTFMAVEKAHIVELRWEQWNLNADEPPIYPATGEPEDYILIPPHDPVIAEALGSLWELVVPKSATILRPDSNQGTVKEFTINLATWNGSDVFRSNGHGSTFFSQRAREWFEAHWSQYLHFQEFASA